MAQVSRNAPCPCGSGKKYKHCHMGKKEEERGNPPVSYVQWSVIVVISVAVGVGTSLWRGPGTGVAFGVAAGLIQVILATALKPPPSSGRGGDPGAINFGSK